MQSFPMKKLSRYTYTQRGRPKNPRHHATTVAYALLSVLVGLLA